MAGPGVNHVNVPTRFSMPPARPLEANARPPPRLAAARIVQYHRIVELPADGGGVTPFRVRSPAARRTTPREAPKGWFRRRARADSGRTLSDATVRCDV